MWKLEAVASGLCECFGSCSCLSQTNTHHAKDMTNILEPVQRCTWNFAGCAEEVGRSNCKERLQKMWFYRLEVVLKRLGTHSASSLCMFWGSDDTELPSCRTSPLVVYLSEGQLQRGSGLQNIELGQRSPGRALSFTPPPGELC